MEHLIIEVLENQLTVLRAKFDAETLYTKHLISEGYTDCVVSHRLNEIYSQISILNETMQAVKDLLFERRQGS